MTAKPGPKRSVADDNVELFIDPVNLNVEEYKEHSVVGWRLNDKSIYAIETVDYRFQNVSK